MNIQYFTIKKTEIREKSRTSRFGTTAKEHITQSKYTVYQPEMDHFSCMDNIDRFPWTMCGSVLYVTQVKLLKLARHMFY